MAHEKSAALAIDFTELMGEHDDSRINGSIRMAGEKDIADIIELWGNSATLKQMMDPVRWKWRARASQIWSEYARSVLADERKFLVICDLKDNGLSGFLVGRIEELPAYYEEDYSLTVEEFYLRPKDRNQANFQGMLDFLSEQARIRYALQSTEKISLRIEALESDSEFTSLLRSQGFKKSSVTYTAER